MSMFILDVMLHLCRSWFCLRVSSCFKTLIYIMRIRIYVVHVMLRNRGQGCVPLLSSGWQGCVPHPIMYIDRYDTTDIGTRAMYVV